ncbi:hypothetical protein SS50377_24973 [Spironucleus salmonicida]|uniref:Uncharacterized protein n=1 Tax=Spironucleus salmonicida TaxID=348837 RepID=A0A9P8LRG7_9EUKA|nr:hypothetical protein SS50377_24966 [Spironucleus salmonicida]KAH0572858.1 hypothetical protein SS50377_24973 [Spironucleus salmonicida]
MHRPLLEFIAARTGTLPVLLHADAKLLDAAFREVVRRYSLVYISDATGVSVPRIRRLHGMTAAQGRCQRACGLLRRLARRLV